MLASVSHHSVGERVLEGGRGGIKEYEGMPCGMGENGLE